MLGALSAAGEDFFAKVGGKVTLKCGVSSYRRSLQWLHGNDLLHSVDQRGFPRSVDLARRSVVRQTNLEISSVRETDAGRFTCSADGTRHEHSLSVFSVSVSVSPTADLLLGSEATLQCDVKGLIEGCEVKWRSPIVDSPEWSPTAQLNPVTSSHNGTWECIITCGSDQLSEHLTITVQVVSFTAIFVFMFAYFIHIFHTVCILFSLSLSICDITQPGCRCSATSAAVLSNLHLIRMKQTRIKSRKGPRSNKVKSLSAITSKQWLSKNTPREQMTPGRIIRK
uniref:Ig-like domain-containing protein n=1 Tax=Neolamprologus brichardi TaxID=32507 RepID=A0A3Q4I209_NEOBR